MNNDNIIINIGRQIGSGGLIIARSLADDFGFRFYDRNLLDLAAKESGFSEKFFEENDEKKGFFKSLFNYPVGVHGGGSYYRNNFSQEALYQFQADAIRKAAEEDNAVFVGRTADYVLRDFANVVNIFITANIDERVERVMKRYDISSEAALKYIHKREERRASYYNYYTGKRWGHAESYDLCVNSSPLGLEATERFIAAYIRQRLKLNE